MLGTHADVSAFCFVEKTKPLPFSAFSAFSAVQSAVYDNGEDFTAEGAEGVGWVLGTHADVSAFCFVEETKPLPFSAFSAVQSAIAWVLRTHAAFGDSWRPITRACGARTLQLFFLFRPNGAMDCSHGWSGAAAQRPDAEPVESG